MRPLLTALTSTCALIIKGCAGASAPANEITPSAPAQLIEIVDFESQFVQPRNLSIWLPAGYTPDAAAQYPVIYAHDGQNLFEPGRSYGGVEWGLDEAAARIMTEEKVRPAIIVGIWNTDERW